MLATTSDIMKQNSIAVNRFGYGARGNELSQAQINPKQWVLDQLQPIKFSPNFPTSDIIFKQHTEFTKEKNRLKKLSNKNMPQRNKFKGRAKSNLKKMAADTLRQCITNSNSVSWRLLDFFSNHFSVTSNGQLMTGLAATLEREAIAPHLLDNFENMLIAVEQHPAMLIYLNNDKSYGPKSRIAKNNKRGLNENLAREILELHTLGVNGGYQQVDVLELAKGITGWSIYNPRKSPKTGFNFRKSGHEPGDRVLLGKKYPQGGVKQGENMLRDLAIHPNTANYLCHKLAHHFVNDEPDPQLVEKMQQTWLATQGNIKQVMFSLFNHEAAWHGNAEKFKTPREYIISVGRSLELSNIKDKLLLNSLQSLGQFPYRAGSPAGYGDSQSDWLGASSLMTRIDWTVRVSANQKNQNAEKIMLNSLGLSATSRTYQAVVRAESREQALTLLFMSPEFQRR